MRSAFCEKASASAHFFGQTSETARCAKVRQVLSTGPRDHKIAPAEMGRQFLARTRGRW